MNCNGQASSLGTWHNAFSSEIKYDTLPSEKHSMDEKRNWYLFRIIAPDDYAFDYRLPDYNGGFYLFFQNVQATAKEMDKQIPFDKLKADPINYVLRYRPAGEQDIGGGFAIPQYNVYSIILPSGVGFEQFDPESENNEWEPYKGVFGGSLLPCPDILSTRLYAYSIEKYDALNLDQAIVEKARAEYTEFIYAGQARYDLSAIQQLKDKNQYDTIVHSETHNVYFNVDLEIYEQSTAPDDFLITYKKFYPNGALKELRRFLPGVYGQSLPVGLTASYNEAGEPENILMDEIFRFPKMANVDFCVKLLEREGFIDLKTGSGKATMQINHHIDPHAPSHGTPRLSIRAPWGIQADSNLGSTLGLLVSRDGVETVYIIGKLSRTILEKFTR